MSTEAAAGPTDGPGSPSRLKRLRRQLLGVALGDAAAVGALTVVARATRSRPSGPTYAAIAAVAAASFAPGLLAVSYEERAVRSRSHHRRGSTASAVLFAAGTVIATTGTVLIAVRSAGAARTRPALIVDGGLLVGGNAIGVPYLLLVRALHAAR